MEAEILVYKKYKNIVTTEDYIAWASCLLYEHDSIELAKLATMNKNTNLFEIEELFLATVRALNFKQPSIQQAIYYYIDCLEDRILKSEQSPISIASEISSIIYEEDLRQKQVEWYEISEWLDQLEYDREFLFSKKEIEHKIKEAIRNKRRN